MTERTASHPAEPGAPAGGVAARLDASVIVCTYNRADSLAQTLACLERQQVQPGVRWEVLVVDNNSKDRTRDVVAARQKEWPALRYGFEQQQGLSHARNHGIAAARGDVLLFTDDDVCPEPDWVQKILDGMAAHGCVACGGYIAPIWEVPPPRWLTERFHGFLAIRADREDTFQIPPDGQSPFGANMAFRREVFQRYGLFDVSRGRKGNVLAGGEDGEMFDRILRSGAKVMFFGDARVHHRVEAFRVRKRYFRRWRYQSSRNLGAVLGVPGTRRIAGVPLYIFPQLARAVGRAIRARLSEPRDEAFFRELLVWHFLGIIRGLAERRHA
jgi:glycosyltransferase involved in cell wall biosynthesis